jgi:phosphopentomutase
VREILRGRRAIVLVLDACGAGALPDATDYGDEGVNTLAHLAEAAGGLELPAMQRLGLGNVLPLAGVPPIADPTIHGRLHAQGHGKDSTSGHWELMGAVQRKPLPTFTGGLPQPLLDRLVAAIGRRVICNQPRNGIAAIEEFGAEHLRTGELILYTSTDSVVQLAAHVQRVSEAELYAACEIARAILGGPDAVGRVIARPFRGRHGAFERTDGRRDFALAPPRSYLDELRERGVEVHGVGKVCDLFGSSAFSECHPGASNAAALASANSLLRSLRDGMAFVNLIETDQIYGHRQDVHGFHRALQQIDAELGRWLAGLGDDDLLIVTADHGVDPLHPSGDHTREHVPLLAVTGTMPGASSPDGGRRSRRDSGSRHGDESRRDDDSRRHGSRRGHQSRRHDGPMADVGASVLAWLTGERSSSLTGSSFLEGVKDA